VHTSAHYKLLGAYAGTLRNLLYIRELLRLTWCIFSALSAQRQAFEVVAVLIQFIDSIMPKSRDAAASAADQQFDQLERKRRLIKRSFNQVERRIAEALTKPRTEALFLSVEPDLEELRELKTKFDQLQEEIVLLVESEDDEDQVFWESNEVSSLFVRTIAAVKVARNACENTVSRESILNTTLNYTNAGEERLLKLQKIAVPKFNGNHRKWLDFKGLFNNLVHDNPDLKPVQKLYYLKGVMVDRAGEMIQHFPILDANYIEAWNTLCTRFDNQRGLIKKLFHDLYSIKKIKSESEICQLLDEVNKVIRGLRAAGEPIAANAGLLTYWVTTCLDEYTEREFELSISDCSKYPTFERLSEFLESRGRVLEDVGGSSSLIRKTDRATSAPSQEMKRTSQDKSIKKSFVATQAEKSSALPSRKCYLCSKPHWLADCQEFLVKEIADRYSLVRRFKLCVACFSGNHLTNECERGKCRTCGAKHHTTLQRDQSKPDASSRQFHQLLRLKHQQKILQVCQAQVRAVCR